jgi:hypothetical protein
VLYEARSGLGTRGCGLPRSAAGVAGAATLAAEDRPFALGHRSSRRAGVAKSPADRGEDRRSQVAKLLLDRLHGAGHRSARVGEAVSRCASSIGSAEILALCERRPTATRCRRRTRQPRYFGGDSSM